MKKKITYVCTRCLATHEELLRIRVAVWDVINLVPKVHSPYAHRRLKYAVKKLNLLVKETRRG
jgi:hypothetical protein